MEIEITEEKDDYIKAELTDSNEAVANSLRRAMTIKTPTLAIKNIEVTKNDSGLFDEILANRIGQIPFTIPQNIDEEDTVHIAIKQEGETAVTAEDITTDNTEAEPAQDALLVRLNEEQELELEGEAKLGYGDQHAKHQGGNIGYEQTSEDTFEFRIESTSGYTNKELLQTAIKQIQEDLDQLEQAI